MSAVGNRSSPALPMRCSHVLSVVVLSGFACSGMAGVAWCCGVVGVFGGVEGETARVRVRSEREGAATLWR